MTPLPETVDFNFHIKPILVQNCYLCHGPDPSSRKANLRLDTFEGATAHLEEGGQAIVPGKASKSKLIYRINHKEEDQLMPPPESNYKLSEREKALLHKWIDQGAAWKPHWSFIKPESEIALNQPGTLDSLIAVQINEKDLEVSPEADKYTLIRRVAYIITGLPPSPDEIQEYVNDKAADAYERMVERYLNSPGYGERWARHWMDLVRYAETKGHEFDYEITGAWNYRDYLIRAFNEDVPYDQILREHIAGDLIESPRIGTSSGIAESAIGTAFLAMGEGTHSPVDIKKDEADRIDNMIDVTSKTFQALTVSCARCHDHKFDPILTADYYAMYGIMESTRFSPLPLKNTREQQTARSEIEQLNLYIGKMVSEKWDEEVKEIASASQKAKSLEEHSDGDKLIGDFRSTDFDGWRSDGMAFGSGTTLGKLRWNKKGDKIVGIDKGKVSSRFYGPGIFGALRSPNFTIDSDFVGIKARGKQSTLRIVIDNFQLIQNPIYGNLQQGVDDADWRNYTFDVSPWIGHKAYIEVLPGGYKRHSYQLPEEAYIEVEYAGIYDLNWPVAWNQAPPAR